MRPWFIAGGILAAAAGVALAAFVAQRVETDPLPAMEEPAADLEAPAELGEPALVETPEGDILLRRPEIPDRWEDHVFPEPSGGLLAMAYQFNAPIYERAREDAEKKGLVRRGTKIRVEGRVYGSGCRGGGWYRVAEGGFVCTSDGFMVSTEPDLEWRRHADLTEALPYDYRLVSTQGAPRYSSVPEAPDAEPKETLEGDFFVAEARVEEAADGTTWVHTARGEVVRAEDTEPAPEQTLVGEELSEERALPLAFVYLEDRPVYRIEGEVAREVGVAQKHARFAVANTRRVGDQVFVMHDQGLALKREHVRVVRAIPHPERVPEGAAWIHVDLAEQTLVAYDAEDRPLYATLVSSGKEGYDTPRGTFRVREKYVSITMNGDDPIDGFYEVEEVPWTMYYWQSYALHGAYWHDDFGQVRSHGCTNLAPADARWLFEWTTPEMPEGWHGRRLRRGTYVHMTR